MKVLESYLAFSDSTPVVGLGCIFRAWPEWNSRLPTWHLRVWVVVGPQFFSVVFGWSRAVYCLEGFSLARLLLWLERAAYVETFLSALVNISRSLPSAMHKAKTNKQTKPKNQTKPRELTSMFFLGGLNSLSSLPSSLNFSEPFNVYFIYNVQGFKLYLEGGIEKITSASLFWKQKS